MMQYNFGPAYEKEEVVFGAERPGFDFHSVESHEVSRWISFVKQNGIERVCSLLPKEQLAFYKVDLLVEYRREFGEDTICSAPIPDMHLCDGETLNGKILPFLRVSDLRGKKVVVHCSGGSGRAGHILSAWLVHSRGFAIDEALSVVRLPRRNPLEAVIIGNASMDDLRALLASCQPRNSA